MKAFLFGTLNTFLEFGGRGMKRRGENSSKHFTEDPQSDENREPTTLNSSTGGAEMSRWPAQRQLNRGCEKATRLPGTRLHHAS